MALADTAALIASLSLKDGFTGPLKKVDKSLSAFDAHLSKTSSRGFKAGQQIGTGIKNGAKIAAVGIGLLATQVIAGINQLSKLEDAQAQTEAVIKSTGGVAGQTAVSVRKLAEQYENLNATIDDKVIQSAENLLLTFTKVGKDAFQPALEAALNLNQALGGGEEGLQGNIIRVGKALQDPVKGITALRRAGVAFTADQVKQITALQKEGDLLGAQKIILGELSTEFGGSFARNGKTATGTLAGIGDAVEDLQKAIATGLFPVIQKVLPRIRDFLTSDKLLADVQKLGDNIAGLFSDSNINNGVKLLEGFFDSARKLAPAIQSAAEVTGRVVKTAVDAFKSLPPEIQSLAIAGLAINKLTGGLVTNIAGGLISAVISSFKGMMNVNAAVVNVNGGVAGGLPGAAAGAAGIGLGTLSIVAAAGVAAAFAFINTHQGAGSTGAFTPNVGAAFDQKPVDASGFGRVNWAKVAQDLKISAADRQRDATDRNRIEDRTYDSIENMRARVAAGLSVDVTNADAIGRAVAQENGKAIVSADRAARGLTGPFKRSTSVNPRLKFLAGNASDEKDVAVAAALARGFEKSSSKAFRSSADLKRSIQALQKDQKTLGPKAAAKVGGYIDRMKAELGRRESAVKAAIDKKNLAVTVNNTFKASTYINGRLLDATTNRFKSTIVGHKGTFAEFG